MRFVDTHAHLDEQSFETDFTDVLSRATEAGLVRIITIGVTVASSRNVLDMVACHSQLSAIVGIHPNYSSQAAPGDFAEIEELALHPRVVGVGETGLDKYWDFAPLDVQGEYFRRHIQLSQSCGKPFVVHCRDAEPETRAVLREMADGGTLNGVMHSFCGNEETLALCLELGMSFSFGGMITYKKNDDLRRIASLVPLDRVMIETDCPYLAPVPMRGKRNEPAHVVHTARCLADIHNLTLEEIGEITTTNASRIFRLPG